MELYRLRLGKRVIGALYEFGIMSRQSLEEHLELESRHAGLSKTLKRLVCSNLINRKSYSSKRDKCYYHLSFKKGNLEKFCKILDKSDLSKISNYHHAINLEHDDLVSKAHASFVKLPLDIKIFNDRQFPKTSYYNTIFSSSFTGYNLIPDLSLIIHDDKKASAKRLNIAIEVECLSLIHI